MLGKRNVLQNQESGQALVVIVLLLLGLLGVLALAVDGGNIYWQRRYAQNAADAGAMVGARVLAYNGTADEARATAQEYAVQRNQADRCDVIIDGAYVTAVAYKDVAMTFGRVVGVQQVTVSARATAMWAPISELGGLAPLSIREFDYQFGVPYTIWDDETDRDPNSGHISGSYRGWLNLPCVYPQSCGAAGAAQLKSWMVSGWPGISRVDTWVAGDGGVKAAVIQQARVGNVLKIAVFDRIEAKYATQTYYHVVKFAAFRVTNVYATGNPKGIKGTFEYMLSAGPSGEGPDGGYRTISLTR
ncbi:MAG: pilus assembly protein TadG-related protein [Anaerolineae bacterium]